jgi:hypothetical protein
MESEWKGCTVPPDGWWCSREKGHDGPCAARPKTETCFVVDVDGEPVRVHGTTGWDDVDHAAFAAIVRAAKQRLREEEA